MKKIAITGGIGSGKSTVVSYLREKGYSVFSCDEIYHEITRSHAYINQINNTFPNVVKNGEIDRKRLAEIVFSNPKKRQQLNDISHPMIMDKLQFDIKTIQNDVVFVEVPLLFEGNYEYLFDEIIVVVRELSERIRSVCQRDGISVEQAQSRMESQINYDDITSLSKSNKKIYVLYNQGEIVSLQYETEKILKDIL